MKTDLHQLVTDSIVSQIEANPGDWTKPWRMAAVDGLPRNATTGRTYRGVNVLTLWSAAAGAGYAQNAWASYKQWQAAGAQVRKGETGTMIVYQGKATKTVDTTEGSEAEKTFRFLKFSYVFNVAQVDGAAITAKAIVAPAVAASLVERVEDAEAFIAGTGADIQHRGDRACYSPAIDAIRLPDRPAFIGSRTSTATSAYYATAFHELTHWTGHKSRLDRNLGGRFGDDAYAVEELVAELGAAFLCAQLGLEASPRADHAQYLAGWLRVLKADKRAIFTAAAKASDAVEFMGRLQPGQVSVAANEEAPALAMAA